MTRWENIFSGIGALALVGFLTLIGTLIVSKKAVTGYSLGGSQGIFVIEKNVEWDGNDKIQLDKTTTLSDAIRMIDSLNKTVVK